jgi:hypothetical protein
MVTGIAKDTIAAKHNPGTLHQPNPSPLVDAKMVTGIAKDTIVAKHSPGTLHQPNPSSLVDAKMVETVSGIAKDTNATRNPATLCQLEPLNLPASSVDLVSGDADILAFMYVIKQTLCTDCGMASNTFITIVSKVKEPIYFAGIVGSPDDSQNNIQTDGLLSGK